MTILPLKRPCRWKMTKFWLSDENFPRWIIFLVNLYKGNNKIFGKWRRFARQSWHHSQNKVLKSHRCVSRYTMASGSADNIKQWKFPDGNFIQNLSGHNSILNCMAINSDGVLVSGGKFLFWIDLYYPCIIALLCVVLDAFRKL